MPPLQSTMASNSEHSMTHARREALRQIITGTQVGRQADLVRMLAKAGHRATQSSVSRDLRELGVAKRGDRYVLPDDYAPASGGFRAVAGFVRQVRPAGSSLTVIRTAAGAAQSVAIVLDRASWPEVVGTISGDDTIFVATDDARAQRVVIDRLRDLFRA